jgi:hypothetical protein
MRDYPVALRIEFLWNRSSLGSWVGKDTVYLKSRLRIFAF